MAAGVGCGCLAVSGLCGLAGLGGLSWLEHERLEPLRAHAEVFLGAVRDRDWASAAHASTDPEDPYSPGPDALQRCLSGTPLADVTSFACSWSEDSSDGGSDLPCTIQSRAQGTQEITVHVLDTLAGPRVSYVWFSATATLGDAWRAPECVRWSGSARPGGPPPGRVRP